MKCIIWQWPSSSSLKNVRLTNKLLRNGITCGASTARRFLKCPTTRLFPWSRMPAPPLRWLLRGKQFVCMLICICLFVDLYLSVCMSICLHDQECRQLSWDDKIKFIHEKIVFIAFLYRVVFTIQKIWFNLRLKCIKFWYLSTSNIPTYICILRSL